MEVKNKESFREELTIQEVFKKYQKLWKTENKELVRYYLYKIAKYDPRIYSILGMEV